MITDCHDREKRLVESAAPYILVDRPVNRQLAIANRQLIHPCLTANTLLGKISA
jgi:hypothetical protein